MLRTHESYLRLIEIIEAKYASQVDGVLCSECWGKAALRSRISVKEFGEQLTVEFGRMSAQHNNHK